MSLEELSLLRPLWLLALPLLAALALWLKRRRGGLGDWERVADPALLGAMGALGKVEAGDDRPHGRAALLAAALVVIALSGPSVERRDAQSFRNLDGVVFVVDVSRSVTEDPLWPQLLTAGRFGIAALGTRPAGLIVYAGDAYVATDLTRDTRQLGQTLSVLNPDTVPDAGSRPERALALADRMLTEAQVMAGDVILLTDGAGLGPEALATAEAIAARGARLSVLSTTADRAGAETLARIGNGRTFGIDQSEALAGWLSENARAQLERQNYPLLFHKDLGRYLLFAALLPMLWLFRRRA
ncbi:VWA domain-containing protein [Salipiger sp.]|uniref:VWA domain-containing protein n=1 Tax=Salipiger sp. TaxID=2078585 RepID=UPI003A96D7A1